MLPDAPQAPLVAVVIPAFNNETTIAAAIESVLEQESVPFELLVSDHSSGDRTREIAESYSDDPRVSVVSAAPGGGAESNWNHVSSLATAPLLKLVCGDDLLLPGVLARQSALMQDDSVALVACRRHVVDRQGRVILRSRGLQGLSPRMTGPEAVRAAVRSGTNPFGEPACVMMRTAVLRAIEGWHGQRPYVLDLETYFRVLEHGNFVADDATGAAFRLSPTQQSAHMTRSGRRDVLSLTRWVAHRHPGLVRPSDRVLGEARCRAWSVARSAAFRLLRWREAIR